MQEEAGGGRHCPPVDRGGGVPSLCLARVGSMAYTAAHPKKTEGGVAQGGAGGVARPPCRGIPFQYVKIVQMSAEYAKLA